MLMDKYYDGIARSYNELYGAEQIKKLEIIKEKIDFLGIKIDSSTKILDVGCGTGIGQEFFEKEYDADTFGIDPSEGLIKLNNFQCMLGEAKDLPFDDNEFHIVISLTAIQNFDDFNYGLDQIKRVAKVFFILTYLKTSQDAKKIDELINSKFEVIEKIEEGKDIIFFLKK